MCGKKNKKLEVFIVQMKKKRLGKKRVMRLRTPREGWTEAKLEKAERVLKKTHGHDLILSHLVFWSAILVVVIGNLMIALALVPFLAVLNQWFLDLVILLLGLVMGFLFNFLMTNVGHLEKHHFVLAGLVLPVVAVVNVIFIVLVSNQMIEAIQIANARHNPWVIGILYGVAFVVPYLYFRLRKIYK